MPYKYREAHKLLIQNGWRLVAGGKGSHRKYKKGGRIFPLPYHGDNQELSKGLDKKVRNLLKK